MRYQESAICKAEAERLKTIIKSHMDINKRLTDEFGVFNSCFNRRVAYYRALQAISDTLVDVELEGDVEEDLSKNTDQVIAAKAAYDKANSRRKYVSFERCACVFRRLMRSYSSSLSVTRTKNRRTDARSVKRVSVNEGQRR